MTAAQCGPVPSVLMDSGPRPPLLIPGRVRLYGAHEGRRGQGLRLRQRRQEDPRRERQVHRRLPGRRPLLRDPQPLPAPVRTALRGHAGAAGGLRRPGRPADGRRPAADRLPLARLGVRPRHRPVVHGPRPRQHGGAFLPGDRPAGPRAHRAPGRRPHPRPLRGRDDAGVGRAGLRDRRRLARPARGGAGMTVTAAETKDRERPRARTLLIDVDVHPLFLPRDILPRLPERWQPRYANEHSGRGPRVVREYPRWRNGGFRIDAAVPGGAPGSDLGVLRSQLLEEYDTDIAILIPLTFTLEGPAEYKAALCRAVNDWLAQGWLDRRARLRGNLNATFDSPDLAVAGIARF